jgi:hypothetical protein
MQMRDESCLELREMKSLHSIPIGSRGSADDAWAQVNEVWGVVDDDGGRGPGPIGVERRSSSPQQYDLGDRRWFVFRLRERDTGPREKQ